MLLVDKLISAIRSSEGLYHRLVLLVGSQGSGKTKVMMELSAAVGAQVINVNLELSRRLMVLPERKRPLQARDIVAEIVDKAVGQVVLLDNVELLFDKTLHLDPLKLLQAISRDKTVVSTWNGTVVGDQLIYAAPDHPEYRREQVMGTLIVTIENPSTEMNSIQEESKE